MVKYLIENGAIMDEEYSGPDNFDGHRIKEFLLKYGFNRFKLNAPYNNDYTTKFTYCCRD